MYIEDIKIGQKIWFAENWTERFVYGIVDKITHTDKGIILSLAGNKYDEDCSYIGSQDVYLDKCFDSKHSLIVSVRKERADRIEAYKKEIPDIASLIAFPLIHSFGCEEYTDYEAIQAYKDRALELGFFLDNIEY